MGKEANRRKLGIVPHSETLNIKQSKDKVKLIEKDKVHRNSANRSYCPGKCFKGDLEKGLKCAIVLPQVIGSPKNIIAVMAPLNLREKLQL